MKVELVTKTEGVGKYSHLNDEEIISAIARHGIIKEDNGKLVKYLMTHHHWSPLDMINYTFEIETSRDIGRQILRHSSLKPQEHSTRYSDRVGFENIEFRKEHPVNRQSSTDKLFEINFSTQVITYDQNLDLALVDKIDTLSLKIRSIVNDIEEIYKEGVSLGVAKECMRKILPGTLKTTMSLNGTLRSWLSFLNVRMDNHTEKECQEIATCIGEELEKYLPNVFSTIDWRQGMFM